MASPNLIFNRLHPSAVCAAAALAPAFPATLLAPLHKWRHERLLQRHTSEAAGRIKAALPDGFSPRAFAVQRRADYERLYAALERGDLQTLKRALSSACMASVRAGQEGRAPLRARLLAWDEGASGVAACGVHSLQRSDAAGFDRPPDFVQVTMRNAYVCEVAAGGAGGAAAPAPGAPPRPRLAVPPPPLWETVLHAGTGTLYWWDRLSGRCTWQQPGAGAFLAAHAAHPFRLETSGVWTAEAGSSDGGASGGARRARVVHDVVWERAVAGGQWTIVRW